MTDDHSETANGSARDLGPASATAAPESSGGERRGPFDLNTQQKRILLVVLVVHMILARFTLRDLRHRPASAVRGPKRLWRVWATMNTTGSVAYWLVGRRRAGIDLAE
jgi:hypothetical protein